MNDQKNTKKPNMPTLDAPAMTAAASSYRLRAAQQNSDDILGLELRLNFLKTATRIDAVIAVRFPNSVDDNPMDGIVVVGLEEIGA